MRYWVNRSVISVPKLFSQLENQSNLSPKFSASFDCLAKKKGTILNILPVNSKKLVKTKKETSVHMRNKNEDTLIGSHDGVCELGEEGEGGGAGISGYSIHPLSPTQPLPSHTSSQITLL